MKKKTGERTEKTRNKRHELVVLAFEKLAKLQDVKENYRKMYKGTEEGNIKEFEINLMIKNEMQKYGILDLGFHSAKECEEKYRLHEDCSL